MTCRDCGRPRRPGRRVCNSCRARTRRLQMPPSPVRGRGGPGVPKRAVDVSGRIEDFTEIRSRRYSVEQAAARLQISVRTAWRYEARRLAQQKASAA